VIEKMKERHTNMDWRIMDVRKMEFEANSFDVAIDKATLDAMLYGSLWDPEEEVRRNVQQYVDEVARVLKPGGIWLYITWRQPHFIKPLLNREGIWNIEVQSLEDPNGGGGFEYFSFIMRKF
jgi:ubiquinone/menaquinone biosynthesis C-methylase UbiE